MIKFIIIIKCFRTCINSFLISSYFALLKQFFLFLHYCVLFQHGFDSIGYPIRNYNSIFFVLSQVLRLFVSICINFFFEFSFYFVYLNIVPIMTIFFFMVSCSSFPSTETALVLAWGRIIVFSKL